MNDETDKETNQNSPSGSTPPDCYPPELIGQLLDCTGRLIKSFVNQSPPGERWHILACFDGLEDLYVLWLKYKADDVLSSVRPITPGDVTREANQSDDLGRKHGHEEKADLLDWAETLLCNAAPMPHCTQADWDAKVSKWRDEKHGVSSTPSAQNHCSTVPFD